MTLTHNASQRPADVAVVISSVIRPSLLEAARSVFRQVLDGRIHLLIGIDIAQGERSLLDRLRAECPPATSLTILDLGYSTAQCNGGLVSNRFGGALPATLSQLANSRYIAYLDDDDWWSSDHLAGLLRAIAGKQWAFAYRWMVHPETLWPICPDEWDSVGPGRGINLKRYGGFVAPSGLMIDREACDDVLPLWNRAAFANGIGNDRQVFEALSKKFTWAASGQFSVFYVLNAASLANAHHAQAFAERGLAWVYDPVLIEAIRQNAAEARACLERGDLAAGEHHARAALAINSHHADSLHCLAQIETAAGRYPAALGLMRHALAVDDRVPAFFATIAEILLHLGQPGEAAKVRALAVTRFVTHHRAPP